MNGGKAVLVCLFVVFMFLFSTGFIFEVTRDVPISYVLGGSRMNKAYFYETVTHEDEPPCAVWLSKNAVPSSNIYGDFISDRLVLLSSGMFLESLSVLTNMTPINRLSSANYVYLRFLNVNYGTMVDSDGHVWNITAIAPQLSNLNRLYSNGGCVIDNGL